LGWRLVFASGHRSFFQMGENLGRHRLFIGTYTKGKSRGIYSLSLDRATGELGVPQVAAEAPNPTFLALSPNRHFLYAVCANEGWASSFRVDSAALLTPIQQAPPGTGPTPCHISVDAAGRIALAANYHLGLAAAIALNADGTMGTPRVVVHSGKGPHPTRQASAHVHSTYFTPDGRFAVVCDLGLDRVYTYRIDRKDVALTPGAPPFVASAPGAGPRHFAFGADGKHAYVINELDSTIVAYEFQAADGSLTPRSSVSVLPSGYRGDATAAEVQVHPNGRFVYGSGRGPDTIAVFAADGATGRLSPVETVACGGKGPRSFSLSPGGEWLVCAHQDSDTLCSFRVDPATGRLSRIPGSVSIPMPVCVVYLD
jgi:6-phosphogluconolactonase